MKRMLLLIILRNWLVNLFRMQKNKKKKMKISSNWVWPNKFSRIKLIQTIWTRRAPQKKWVNKKRRILSIGPSKILTVQKKENKTKLMLRKKLKKWRKNKRKSRRNKWVRCRLRNNRNCSMRRFKKRKINLLQKMRRPFIMILKSW